MVEDEKILGEISEITLTEAGFKVVTSADGLEALALIEKEDFIPDLIITDVVMPGIHGPQIIERIRKKLPDVKVVYISGYPDETIVNHGILESDVPFIQKPFSGTTLKTRVLEVIKRKNKLYHKLFPHRITRQIAFITVKGSGLSNNNVEENLDKFGKKTFLFINSMRIELVLSS